LRNGRDAPLAVRLAKALGLPFARRRRSLGDSNRQHMGTTALDVDSRERAPPSEQSVIDLARDPHLGREKPTATSTSTLAAPAAEQLDLATALKISEEISGEMVLERLIDKVLSTAIEHAGAQRGLLIVSRGDELRIEVEARAAGEDVTVYLGERVDGAAALPESILRSVVRTRQSVLLDDAAAPNAFSADPYIDRHASRSILCLPLLNQGKLIGLLYLENNLAAGVFAPVRIAVMKLLASQAATALKNAHRYRELTECEAKFRRLVDSNIVGISIWDLDGRVLEANEAFLRIVGYERDDLISGRLCWTDFVPSQGSGRTPQELVALLQGGESLPPYEWEYTRKDGSRVPVVTGGW
jgi:PAS domain S-box-containing protein